MLCTPPAYALVPQIKDYVLNQPEVEKYRVKDQDYMSKVRTVLAAVLVWKSCTMFGDCVITVQHQAPKKKKKKSSKSKKVKTEL